MWKECWSAWSGVQVKILCKHTVLVKCSTCFRVPTWTLFTYVRFKLKACMLFYTFNTHQVCDQSPHWHTHIQHTHIRLRHINYRVSTASFDNYIVPGVYHKSCDLYLFKLLFNKSRHWLSMFKWLLSINSIIWLNYFLLTCSEAGRLC